MYIFFRWFSPEWYKYIFEKPLGDEPLIRVWCRINGHKCGIVYYTTDPEATEPDGRCKHCGDYIG